jgi:ABC-type xylose transport system permease subunit
MRILFFLGWAALLVLGGLIGMWLGQLIAFLIIPNPTLFLTGMVIFAIVIIAWSNSRGSYAEWKKSRKRKSNL